jgi:ankyrin repeat protein
MKRKRLLETHHDAKQVLLFIVALAAVLFSPGCGRVHRFKTERKFRAHYYEWLREKTVAAYEKTAGEDAATRRANRDFLDQCCRTLCGYADYLSPRKLVALGKGPAASGTPHPLVLGWYGIALHENRQYQEAEVQIQQAVDLLEKRTDLPLVQDYYFHSFLADARKRYGNRDGRKTNTHARQAVDRLKEAIAAGEFQRNQSSIALRLLLGMEIETLPGDRWETVSGRIEKEERVDPWLILMVQGMKEHETGWEARGCGFADEVTPEGWQKFGDHLVVAREKFTKAWEMRPEWPEAANMMVQVATAGYMGAGETTRLWFDRAVDAQFDYYPAYASYIRSLRPRWNGSHDAMLEFGEECLKSGRFDTIVPTMYLKAISDIADEAPIDSWRVHFRRRDVEENLDLMCQSLLRSSSWNTQERFALRTLQALVTGWCGHYDKAKELLGSIEEDVDICHPFYGRILSYDFGYDLEMFRAELRAFTGPQKELLMEAERFHLEDQDPEKSLELFKQARDESNDSGVRNYLLDRMAMIMLDSCRNGDTTYPIISAAWDGRTDVVAFLLDNGEDVNRRNVPGCTPLLAALHEQRFELARMLIERGADLSGVSNVDWTPLRYAMFFKQLDLIDFIIQKGGDPNIPAGGDWRPLHIAVYEKDVPMARLFLEKGADPNALPYDKWAPIFTAIKNNDLEMVKELIAHKADLQLEGFSSWRPLHFALFSKAPDIADTLIEAGADVNMRASTGWCPIHFAAKEGYANTVRLLLRKGAKTDEKFKEKTPLEWAKANGHEDIVKLLSGS